MRNFFPRITINNHLMYALKIGIGSALAIYIAELLQLEFSSSAGIITLLSVAGTKTETRQLGIDRLTTFILMVFLSVVFHLLIGKEWIGYGIVLVLLTFILSMKSLLATLSVNAVALSHLLRLERITAPAVFNEFLLLAIGLVIAIIINHFQNYESQRRYLQIASSNAESRIKGIFLKLSEYLKDPQVVNFVWDDIIKLEKDLMEQTQVAFQYQQNRLPSRDDYYTDYFEMRLQQTGVLHNLHYEMKKVRQSHEDALIVAGFLDEIVEHISDMHTPDHQLHQLDQLVTEIQEQNLPSSRDEFLSKARVYHILMDLEEFLVFKKRFIKEHGEG